MDWLSSSCSPVPCLLPGTAAVGWCWCWYGCVHGSMAL
uniref:Uncharacterized protein n=1 Tax=Arundo donax TaxID=35708 RepID=A0A0A9KU06_ARUDO